MKETYKQTKQQLLIEKTSHEETRLKFQNTRSVHEKTQQELEGKVYV